MPEPVLSIVIVNYNTRDLLAECLASLLDYPPQTPHEIVVVDNASSDDSPAMVAEKYPSVVCLACEENLGFSAGNNRGVARARGEYVLLLNPDTRAEEGALDSMLAFLRQSDEVGILGCRQIDERGWPQLCYGRDPTALSELRRRSDTLGLAAGDARVRSRVDGRYLGPASVDWVTGACMMMKRQVYTRLGGMDEGFWLYFEDADLCRRVRGEGLRVVYHPGITIFHRRGAAMSKVRPATMVAYRAAQLRYARIHSGLLTAAFVRALALVKGGLMRLVLKSPECVWVGRQLIRLALLGEPEPEWRGGPGRVDTGSEVG